MFRTMICSTDDGASLFVRVFGEMQPELPVVLVHGACVDSRYFDGLARILAQDHLVVTYDRRGYGQSTLGTTAASVERQAADLLLVMQCVGLGEYPLDLVAHSAGSAVALAFASHHRRMVRKLLIHEPALFDFLDPDDPVFATIGQAMEYANEGLYLFAGYQVFQLESTLDDPAQDREFIQSRKAFQRVKPARETSIPPEDVERNFENFFRSDAQPLYQFRAEGAVPEGIPIAIGIGQQSGATYHARNIEGLSVLLDARIIAFPGGHDFPTDYPLEFSRIVEGFLNPDDADI